MTTMKYVIYVNMYDITDESCHFYTLGYYWLELL